MHLRNRLAEDKRGLPCTQGHITHTYNQVIWDQAFRGTWAFGTPARFWYAALVEERTATEPQCGIKRQEIIDPRGEAMLTTKSHSLAGA